jgi:hypothetical protein
MFTKESVEKKWSDYAQAAQQEGKVSALPTLLKTTGVLAGVAIVPCLSAGTAQAAIVTGTNFTVNSTPGVTGGPVVAIGDSFKAFNGNAGWYLVNNFTRSTYTFDGSTYTNSTTLNSSVAGDVMVMPYLSIAGPANVLDSSSGYALLMPAAAVISAGAGSFSNYMGVPASGNGYLGIEFDISGGTHYGWIEVSLSTDPEQAIELVKWGYNDEAGESIEAGQIPEPTTMALLACGAAGLMAKRRKKKASA